jgi:5-carboxymethyl-2-hydroxymuconate isomerase
MPHIAMNYSKELESLINIPEMLHDLHLDLASRETVLIEAIKTYAMPIQYCEVALDNGYKSMIHIIIKVLPGRSIELKQEMTLGLRKIVKSYIKECSVTVELQELEAETYCK